MAEDRCPDDVASKAVAALFDPGAPVEGEEGAHRFQRDEGRDLQGIGMEVAIQDE